MSNFIVVVIVTKACMLRRAFCYVGLTIKSFMKFGQSLPLLLSFWLFPVLSIAQEINTTPQPKVVFLKLKSTLRTEKQLQQMIRGCHRVDTAYKRVEPYFNAALGDYFKLRCFQCLANSGPMVQDFPKNKDIKTVDKTLILGTAMQIYDKGVLLDSSNIRFKTDPVMCKMQGKIAEAVFNSPFAYSGVNVMTENEIFSGNVYAYEGGTQLFGEKFAQHGKKPSYVILMNIDNYSSLTYDDVKRTKELMLKCSFGVIDVNTGEILASKKSEIREQDKKEDPVNDLLNNIADKTSQELAMFMDSIKDELDQKELTSIALDVSELNAKDLFSVKHFLDEQQVVVRTSPETNGVMKLMVACSQTYLADLLNEYLPSFLSQVALSAPQIRIRKAQVKEK